MVGVVNLVPLVSLLSTLHALAGPDENPVSPARSPRLVIDVRISLVFVRWEKEDVLLLVFTENCVPFFGGPQLFALSEVCQNFFDLLFIASLEVLAPPVDEIYDFG